MALSRDDLGRIVRNAWCGWAKNQPQARMKDSWLVPYEELSEPDKEVDRLIAEAVIRRIEPTIPVAIVTEGDAGSIDVIHVFFDLDEANEFKWKIGGSLYFGDDELIVHPASPAKETSMAEHTKGRLTYHGYGNPRWYDLQGDETCVAQAVLTEADARRLVACWNTCEGISTEDLESGVILRVEMKGSPIA